MSMEEADQKWVMFEGWGREAQGMKAATGGGGHSDIGKDWNGIGAEYHHARTGTRVRAWQTTGGFTQAAGGGRSWT